MTAGVRQERSAPPAKAAGDGAGDEQRHRQRVDRRHERSHARVDDAGREKQLERVGRNPELIEQKRHGRVEAAEEAHEPGERQLRIARTAAPSASANHPAKSTKLSESSFPVCGKLKEAGTMTSVSRPGSRSPGSSRSSSVRLACDQARQHDEQVAGDEGGEERVVRLAEDVPGSNRRERGDQSRQHPQAHQQRHGDVRHEVDLQAAQLLQLQRPRRIRRNRKQSVGREARHEARGARDRVSARPAGRRAAAPGVRRRPARRPG